MHQLDIFELTKKQYKIAKKIRLIELFAGIGSQAQALKKLGVPFEHYRVIELDKNAIHSYNAVHGTDFVTQDITKINAHDLGIKNTEKYEYILTYSFPCQALSKAGKQEGMKKGSGTTSGLLWEVERLLNECVTLPQILLMENVPDVCGNKHIKDFQIWIDFLEGLGYTNYIECLNAKNYGIPQNRNRAFMVSIFGDYYYNFPEPIPLISCLKDMLEEEVDIGYYLTEVQVRKLLNSTYDQNHRFNCLDGISYTLTTKDQKVIYHANPNDTEKIDKGLLEGIKIPEATKQGYAIARDGDGVYINRPHQKRGVVQKGMIQTIKSSCADIGVVIGSSRSSAYIGSTEKYAPTLTASMGTGGGNIPLILNRYYIRRLTELESWRLMGFDDSSFYRAKEVTSKTQLYKQAGNSIVVNVLEAIFKQFFVSKNKEE